MLLKVDTIVQGTAASIGPAFDGDGDSTTGSLKTSCGSVILPSKIRRFEAKLWLLPPRDAVRVPSRQYKEKSTAAPISTYATRFSVLMRLPPLPLEEGRITEISEQRSSALTSSDYKVEGQIIPRSENRQGAAKMAMFAQIVNATLIIPRRVISLNDVSCVTVSLFHYFLPGSPW